MTLTSFIRPSREIKGPGVYQEGMPNPTGQPASQEVCIFVMEFQVFLFIFFYGSGVRHL